VSQAVAVQAIAFTEVVDDVGALTGNALDRQWSFGLDPVTGSQGHTSARAGGTTLLDDSLPMLKGSLGVDLVNGQTLDIYLGSTRLGAALVTGTNWEYQFTAGQELGTGAQTLSARVVSSSGALVMASDNLALNVTTPLADLSGRLSTSGGVVQFSFLEAGQTLDLTAVSGLLQPRIDQVNLTGLGFPGGSANQLTLSLSDVLQGGVGNFVEGSGFAGLVADGRSQLLVTGIPGGVVNLVSEGASWVAAGSTTHSTTGQTYHVFNNGTNAQLLIDADLTRSGAFAVL
jgi:hypothetical protein